ncbi:MAG: hypothetical protein GQ531_10120 [Sulfurovum sp.]|nr:hypothetical protein [Sulfurovum sp.]
MKTFKLSLLALLFSFTALYAQSAKVVFDLTTGDVSKIEKHLISNIKSLSKYYKEKNIDFKAIVVISGASYRFFVEDLKNSPYKTEKHVFAAKKKLNKVLQDLHDNDAVTFNMCKVGMTKRKISPNTLYKYVNAVDTKSIYLIRAQNDGYAYIPVH